MILALQIIKKTIKTLAMKRIKASTVTIPSLLLSILLSASIVFSVSCSKAYGQNEKEEVEVVIKSDSIQLNEQQKKEDVFVIVEEMPVFDNDKSKSFEKFRSFIGKNMKFPDEAKKNGTEGTVYVSFIVEKDGSVSNVKVERSASPSLDQEAIRVVQSSPKWQPGKQKGEFVRVIFTFPIVFSLH